MIAPALIGRYDTKTLGDVEFDIGMGLPQSVTQAIGPLVLTTPFLRRLGLREIINRLCSLRSVGWGFKTSLFANHSHR